MVRFQCPDCPRDFSRHAHLRNHLKTHEKEKIEQGLAQLQDNTNILEELSDNDITDNDMQQLEECLDISEEDNANMINSESDNSNNEQESNNFYSSNKASVYLFYIYKEQ